MRSERDRAKYLQEESLWECVRELEVRLEKAVEYLPSGSFLSMYLHADIKDHMKAIDELRDDARPSNALRPKHLLSHCWRCNQPVYSDGLSRDSAGNWTVWGKVPTDA